MKKGFTLIELLAVIVILSVISLITTPIIVNVVEDSRKAAFKATCNEIYMAYNNYETQEGIIGVKHIIFDFGSDRTEAEIIDGIKYEPISKLSLNGELPKAGTYEIKDGKRELLADNGKYTCVRNENRNDILDGLVVDNDITEPVLREIILSSTTKSIKVIVDGYEEDGLITKYYYQINGGELIPSDTNVYVFDNLNTKEEYEIKVYVENKSGLKSEVISKKIETKEISGTTYEESYTETGYEYSTSKVITINYDSQEGLNYYLKVDVEAEVVSGVIEECGLDTLPGSCTSTSVTVLEPNKWYRTKESTTSLLFKQEGNIYTVVSDGKNTSSENTYEVVKVSDEVPTTPVITGGDESWSTEAKIINISDDSTVAGGVKNYQYCISTVSTECNGTWIDLEDGATSVTISANGTNYTFIRAIGKNGKVSEVTQPQITVIDTNNPNVSAFVSGKIATFILSDNIGVVAYGVNQSEESEPTYIDITSTTSNNISWTAPSAGTYVAWVKDVSGRIGKTTFTVDSSAFNYNATQTTQTYTATGTPQTYTATGTPQTYTATKTPYTYAATGTPSSYCSLPKYTCPDGSVGYGTSASGHKCPGQGSYDYNDCKQWNSTTSYSCPSGGTLSGTTCSSTKYTCPSGGTLSGTTCTRTVYSCPNGGTLSGTTCTKTIYSCPSGGTLSGTTCTKTVYICPDGGTLNGTICER